MKQITIVSQKTNQEFYNFLCSKYRDYANNNKDCNGLKGISYHKRDQRWQASIKVNNKRWLLQISRRKRSNCK